MSISKLGWSSQTAAASGADAFAAANPRRGKWTSDTDPDAPSFEDTLQESRTQLTQAPAPDPDAKPYKKTSQDDSQGNSSDAQQPTDQDAPQSTPAQALSTDNADVTPSTADQKSKDSKDDTPKNPSSDPILQALAASANATVAVQMPQIIKAGADISGKASPTSKLANVDLSRAAANAAAHVGSEKAASSEAPADAPPANPDAGADTDSGSRHANSLARANKLVKERLKEVHEEAGIADNSDGTPSIKAPPEVVAVPVVVVPDVSASSLAPPTAKADASGAASAIPLTAGSAAAGPAASLPADVAPSAHVSHGAEAGDPLDQIVLGLKSDFDPRAGKAEIRLDPPNLGTVKVSLSLQAGALTAQFESSSEMVRDLLKTHLDKLKTVLQSQGVAVDRLAVEAPADAQGQGQSSSFGSATHDGHSAGHYQQDPRQQRGQANAEAFAGIFSQAQEAPLDLVA